MPKGPRTISPAAFLVALGVVAAWPLATGARARLITGQQAAAAPVRTERIALRFVRPSEIVAALKAVPTGLPTGTAGLTPEDRDNTLSVRGTESAIARVKELVALLDVAPRIVQVKMRLIRIWFVDDGKMQEDVLGKPVITARSNQPAVISVSGRGGYTVALTPRVNGDGTITLTTTLRFSAPVGGAAYRELTATRTRRFDAGKTERVVGVTDSPNAGIQETIRLGALPEKWAPASFYAYYVEATASEVTGEPATKTP